MVIVDRDAGKPMTDPLLAVLHAAVDAVVDVLSRQEDWSLTGQGNNQYHHDTAADAAAIAVLDAAGLAIFSEESGVHNPERPVMVVIDPVDGSTNASRGLPWWAVSLCALDASGPLAAVVAGPPLRERFEAVRGKGASRNGTVIAPSKAVDISQSIIAFNGYPAFHYGWAQYRALGAAALELCAVACGAVDGFVDCSPASLAPWDYLGGLLVCQEAGAQVTELYGRDLVVRRPGERRTLVAAGTPLLLDGLVSCRLAQKLS
jgi:myo-inositol-1(or 4)-monophosphatase